MAIMGLDDNVDYKCMISGGSVLRPGDVVRCEEDIRLFTHSFNCNRYEQQKMIDSLMNMMIDKERLILNKPLKFKRHMSIVDKVKLALKPEPEKTLIKAGILNDDNELTCEGKQILNMILLEEYKEKLVEKANVILVDEDKK